MNSYQVLSLRKIKTNYGSYHSAFSTLYERLRDPWSGICYSAEAPGSGSLSWWWVASACLASDGLTNCRISPSRLCVLCSYSLPHHGDYNFSIFMKMMLNKKLSPIVVMEVKKAKKKKKKKMTFLNLKVLSQMPHECQGLMHFVAWWFMEIQSCVVLSVFFSSLHSKKVVRLLGLSLAEPKAVSG